MWSKLVNNLLKKMGSKTIRLYTMIMEFSQFTHIIDLILTTNVKTVD